MLIAKRFTFDAAHRLATLPPTHKCHHLHGHTYEVEIVIAGGRAALDEHGMLADYDLIAKAWAPVHALLDHKYLNEIPGLEKPTTEILARWIICALLEHNPWLRPPGTDDDGYAKPWLMRVRVEESSTTWCETGVDEVDYLMDFRDFRGHGYQR